MRREQLEQASFANLIRLARWLGFPYAGLSHSKLADDLAFYCLMQRQRWMPSLYN